MMDEQDLQPDDADQAAAMLAGQLMDTIDALYVLVSEERELLDAELWHAIDDLTPRKKGAFTQLNRLLDQLADLNITTVLDEDAMNAVIEDVRQLDMIVKEHMHRFKSRIAAGERVVDSMVTAVRQNRSALAYSAKSRPALEEQRANWLFENVVA